MANPLPRALGEALGSVVRGRLPEVMRELLKELEQALFEQRLRAFSNTEAQACNQFQSFCQARGEKIIAGICESICGALTRGPVSALDMSDTLTEWTLVDDAEVEEMLLARRLVRSLRDNLGGLEWRVCACLNRLYEQHVADADHPLSLEFLLRRLQDGLGLRDQPAAIRSLYLLHAGRLLPRLLQRYLEALAVEFEAYRVEPLPAPQAPERPHRAPPSPRVTPTDAAFQAIRRLRRTAHAEPEVAASSHDPQQLTASLQALQGQAVPAEGWRAETLLGELERRGCGLSSRQREDTHLVSEVFHALGEEARVAAALKPALQRLLPAVLDATLRDSAALANERHPVRATLDRLLRLCDCSDPPNRALESRLEDLIERICNDYQGDIATFSGCDRELDELLQIQQRAYQHSAERVMQIHRGHDILEQARREVADALAQLHGEQVAQVLLDWLDCGWRELLVNELIRSGNQSTSWQTDLALTGTLARHLQDDLGSLAHTDLVSRAYDIEHMLEVVRRRMDEFGAGQFQHGPVLAHMRRQLLGEEPVQRVTLSVPQAETRELPPEMQRWRERLDALKEGDWLQARDGQSLQLVWSNPEMDHHVLVDGRGREAGSYRSRELIEQLARGELLVGEAESKGQSMIQSTLQDIVGQLYREIAHARSHDELTGLLNRRSFEGALAQSLSLSTRAAFLMIHVDQFSLLNTQGGPVAGDTCLRLLANTLRQRLEGAACVARIGGVDFAVILPDCNEEQAVALGESLRTQTESEGFVWEGYRHGLTLSIGVVAAAERHDVANLLCDLQTACDAAKEAGRNRVHRFAAEHDDVRTGLRSIAARIDDVVAREQLSLRVQQIAPADPESQELPHYELLLVMENELLLQDFIAAAERYQRMSKVDRWVLQSIFIELERHPQIWSRCNSLSINLSGSSLNDDKLLGFIESLFERHQVDPRRICFELTETAAVTNITKTADLVRQLRRAGCCFSLDDFGVGYSSFDYLKRLPVDYVKIDGSFVREIERSSGDLAMVRSINEIAHALGHRSIAEYVETPSIRARLKDLGLDYVQGFGVQKPLRLSDWLGQSLEPGQSAAR